MDKMKPGMGQEREDAGELPIAWPSDIEYLRLPLYSSAIPALTLKILHTPTAETSKLPRLSLSSCPFPSPAVRITPITTPSHPANGESGLFATRNLPPSSLVLFYIGRVHTSQPNDTDITSSYDISLDRDLDLAIDAAKSGNEARFVNDYRGIAEKPNAEFQDCWVQLGPGRWERWIGIFVLSAGKAGKRKQGIRAGEEILVSYGKGFWKERKG